MDWLTEREGSTRISVRVKPSARLTQIVSLSEEALTVTVAAPPTEGKANEALVRYLADVLAVPRRAVNLEHGQSGRVKRFAIVGIGAAAAMAALNEEFERTQKGR